MNRLASILREVVERTHLPAETKIRIEKGRIITSSSRNIQAFGVDGVRVFTHLRSQIRKYREMSK